MKDPLIELGLLIRTAREQAGLSIDELASESRVSAHHIENIEIANRSGLPEEAYLTGFLSKILKTLKIENASSIVAKFKNQEGDFIVQSLINNNDPEQELIAENKAYFKIYHLYILLVLFFFVIAWFVINSANRDNEENHNRITIKKELVETKQEIHVEKETKAIEQVDENTEEKIDLTLEEPEKKYDYKNTLTRGHGDKTIIVRVKEVAWVQVIGMDDRKILFEGDVFPSREPNQFKFRDDDGFVIATGNAGAFEVDTGEGPFMLGASGQLIKWFYPKSMRRRFERQDRTSRYKEQQLVGI